MRIKNENAGAPAFVKIDKQLSIEYKPKRGKFVIKDIEKNWEATEVSEIEMIIIANSRFTLTNKDWQSKEFTGTYRSPKQTITIMDGKKVAFKGTYAEVKQTLKYDYTGIMHVVVLHNGEWKNAEFKYKGVVIKMLGDIESQLQDDGIIRLRAEETPTFESKAGKLYMLQVEESNPETPEAKKIADEFTKNVLASYKSEDDRYEYFKNNNLTEEVSSPEEPHVITAEEFEEMNPEDIPF